MLQLYLCSKRHIASLRIQHSDLSQTGTCQRHTMCSCSRQSSPPQSDTCQPRTVRSRPPWSDLPQARAIRFSPRVKPNYPDGTTCSVFNRSNSQKAACTPDPVWYLPATHHAQSPSMVRPVPCTSVNPAPVTLHQVYPNTVIPKYSHAATHP